MANLTPVGVAAVVEGLSSFTSGMNQMQNGMQKTGEAAEKSAGPFSSLGSSISRVGSDFTNLGQQLVTGAIVGGIGAVAAAFTGLVAASKIGLDSLMGWGEQLDRLGDQFGITGESASMWTVAMNRVGLSVEEGGQWLNYLTKNLDNVKSAQESETTTTVKSSDAIAGLNQRLEDANTRLARTKQTLAEAEKPTNAMRWAVDDAQLAVTRLNEELAGAQTEVTKTKGTISPFQKALDTLGISAFDGAGNIRELDSIMPEIMDKFQKLPVGVNASALAMDLFGARGGTKFLDFLRQGKQGLADAQQMAKAFGLEMSTDGMNAVESYGFALNELNLGLTGIKNQIGQAVLPYARQFIEWAKGAVPVFVQLAQVLGDKMGAGLQVIQNAVAAFQAGGLGAGLTALFGVAGGDVGAFFDNLTSDISNLANTIYSILVPAFNWIITNALPMMSSAIGFVNENWDAFMGAIIGIGAVLAGAAIVAAIAGVGAAIAALVTPIGLVIAAAAAIGAAWETNFLGMRDVLTAFWAQAQPIVAEWAAWYGQNIPAAIQALAAIWNGVLLPAFQAAGAFIQSSVIPALTQVYTWLATNIPAAIQTVSGFWTGTLLPAMQTVGAWMNTYLLPAFLALGDFIGAVLNLTLTAMAGLWQNVVYPALLAVGNFLAAQLTPAFTNAGTTISTVFGPAVQFLVDNTLVAFQLALQGIQNALTWVTTKLGEMTASLNSVQLPDWLKPGSPTPFEMGLKGIADMLSGKLTKALEGFSATAPPIFKSLAETIAQIKADLSDMAETTLVRFGEAMGSVGSAMVSSFTAAWNAIENMRDTLDDLRSALSGISSAAQQAGSSFNSFNNATSNISYDLIPALRTLLDVLQQIAAAAAAAADAISSIPDSPPGAGAAQYKASPYGATALTGPPVVTSGGGGVTVNVGPVTISSNMDLAEFGQFIRREVVAAMG